MSKESQPELFTQVNVGPGPIPIPQTSGTGSVGELCFLMREMISLQQRQNEYLKNLVLMLGAGQRQRLEELANWKKANPTLAKHCRSTAETLSKIQNEYLASLVEEVEDNAESMEANSFLFNEFLDRSGPRFVHLGALIQAFGQLGNAPDSQSVPPNVL